MPSQTHVFTPVDQKLAERVTAVNLLSSKVFKRDRVQRFNVSFDGRTAMPVAALELASGKAVALDATRNYSSKRGRAAVDVLVVEMNRLIGADNPSG